MNLSSSDVLSSPDWRTHVKAILGGDFESSDDTYTRLRDALSDPQPQVQLAAVFTLVRLNQPGIPDALKTRLAGGLTVPPFSEETYRRQGILLVDDDTFMNAGYHDILELDGYSSMVLARDGVEALELADLHRPLFMFVNRVMPRLGGIEAIREIAPKHPGAVIVLHSFGLEASPELNLDVLTCGASTGFTLPCDAEDVLRLAAVALALPDIFGQVMAWTALRRAIQRIENDVTFHRFQNLVTGADIAALVQMQAVHGRLEAIAQTGTAPNSSTAARLLLRT